MSLDIQDNITSIRTGTAVQPYETVFKVPESVNKIVQLRPTVLLTYETAGETIIVTYVIYRGSLPIVGFESDPIAPPEQYESFVKGRGSWGLVYQVDLDVTPGETLKLIRQNKDYYTCSPIAGLEIGYSSVNRKHT